MAIDTEKLHAILTAAQNPAFKKLIDERTKKQEEKVKIDSEILALDEKIAGTIPPELLALLSGTPAGEPKPRKRKTSAAEATPETPANGEMAPAAEVPAVEPVPASA